MYFPKAAGKKENGKPKDEEAKDIKRYLFDSHILGGEMG